VESRSSRIEQSRGHPQGRSPSLRFSFPRRARCARSQSSSAFEHGTLLSDSAGCVSVKWPLSWRTWRLRTSFRSFDSSSSSSPADAVRRPEGQAGLRGRIGAAHSLQRHRVTPERPARARRRHRAYS
jgi:hypothetical protein